MLPSRASLGTSPPQNPVSSGVTPKNPLVMDWRVLPLQGRRKKGVVHMKEDDALLLVLDFYFIFLEKEIGVSD